MSTDEHGTTTLLDVSGEYSEPHITDPYLDEVRMAVSMHARIAARRTREGSPMDGFQELVRAARKLPMNSRLAAALVTWSLKAGTMVVAKLLIGERLEDAEGEERLDVQRQLARLARRSDELESAQEMLSIILAENPGDRRARSALNALLFRRKSWEELDASLDKEVRELVQRGQLKAASRSALRRARLWGETLDDPARAALRAMQAAQFAEQARDFQAAFALRVLWLRNLHRATAPGRALDEAAKLVLSLGEKTGQQQVARAVVDELKADADVPGNTLSLSGEMPTPTPKRRTTQLELMAIADAVGARPEAAAILAVAVREGPAPQAAQKLEAHFIQRGAWRELAEFYREQSARAVSREDKAHWGEKLAELLESELKDVEGAARAWAEVAAATGDSRAVSEQVRLLEQKKDNSGIQRALDAGVRNARTPPEKARAYVIRAQEAVTRQALDAAKADFEAALEMSPGYVEAVAGLAELSPDAGRLRTFEQALFNLSRRQPGRGELFRRLARLADLLRDAKLARSAWAEVVAEIPGDEEGTTRLATLTRAAGDENGLEQQLRASIAREPRGAKARQCRMELVTLLERNGRFPDALVELKEAVRYEPGHREAWVAYAERMIVAGTNDGEAAWALENAATATEDPAQRVRIWQRLARFCRDRLRDPARAEIFEKRVAAAAMPKQTVTHAEIVKLPPKERALKSPFDAEEKTAREFYEDFARKTQSRVEPEPPPKAHARVAPHVMRQLREPIVGGAAAEEVDTGETPQTTETPVELGDPEVAVPSSLGPSPRKADAERTALFEHVRANPLNPDGYKMLAEHFDGASDPARQTLMLEIARALEGDPHAAPRAPRLILTEADRANLRHPSLRGEAGELLSLVGVVLCRLNPARGKEAGSDDEFSLDSGRGAKAVADSLLTGVRVLGVRAPAVYLTPEAGPPLSLVYTSEPRILVGRMALRKEVSDAELRFFSGRVLFTQQPELLALRSLRREQLLRGLVLVAQVAEGRASAVEMKIFREVVPQRAWERMRQLVRAAGTNVDLAALAEGARHSANRAGLVVCGGVAPAIASLRAKRALPSEMIELVRFAASERHLQLRNRNLPGR